ncbi:DegV family protein [Streptococcus iniae]
MTFKLMTDSAADLNEDWINAYAIFRLGLTVEMDGNVYETFGEDALTTDFLLNQMKTGSQPKTSQVNVGQFEEAFRTFAKEQKEVLYISLSSALSGTYNSALMARDMVLEDYPDAKITIIDSLLATGGQGLLVLMAREARAKGFSLDQTETLIRDSQSRLRAYFLVDDLFHLMRGGRVSKGVAILGSLASIKPLLKIAGDGQLTPIAKIKGRKKAKKELMQLALSDLSDKRLVVAYNGTADRANELKEELLAETEVSQVLLLPIGPVISAHLGTDALAVFVIGKEPRQ